MRILYLTQTLPPEPGATKRPLKQARHLQELGHQVTILGTMPCYPLGRLFDGYRAKLILREKLEGVDVVRIASLPAANKGIFRRALRCFSFAGACTMAGLFLKKPDLIIASVPDIGTDLAGLLIGRLRGAPVLLELRDLIPDNLLFIGISERSLLFRILSIYYQKIYAWMDLIAVVNYNMTAALERKGVSSKRLLVLPHAVDQDFWATIGKADLRCRFHLEDKFIVLYAGSFSPYYDVPNIVLAASLLQKRNPEIHFLLLGTGPDALRVEEMILHRHISNVTYMGPVAPSNVADYLRASDLFLAPLVSRQSLKFYRNHLSTKVCEYLAVGRPVVAIGNGATLGDFLGRIEAGAGVPMGQPEALAAQIKFYATHHEQTMRCGLNARRYALEHLDRRSVIRTFERQLVLKLVSA